MKYLIAYIIQFLTIAISAQSYPVKHFSTNDGLVSNIVYDAIQDDQGFMWFATNIGVSRFDGKDWRNFTINDGLGDNEILKIKKDTKGRLWLFGFNGSVNIIVNGKIYNETNQPLLSKIEKGFFYRHFLSNERDEIILSNRKTNSYRINFPHSITSGEGIRDSMTVFSIGERNIKVDKKFILDLPFNTLNKTNLNLASKIQLLSWYIYNKSFFAVTENNILKIDSAGSYSLFTISLPKTLNVIDFYFKNENELWISADKQGIYHYSKKNNEFVFKEKLLKENHITATWIDKEGNHWFTTYGSGIFMFPYDFESVANYSTREGLHENDAFSVCVDEHEVIWVGHKFVNIDVIEKSKIKNIKLLGSNASVGRVGKILTHPSGYIILSSDEGMFISKNSGIEQLDFKSLELELSNGNFHKNQPIKDFTIDKTGNIYVASQENIHILKNNDLLKQNLNAKRLDIKLNRIFAIAVDDLGAIWYSDSEGLAKYSNGKIERFHNLSKLIKTRIEDIVIFHKQIFISVLGTGIFILEKEKLKTILTTETGLLSNHCSKLYPYKDILYVCTNKGLNSITFDKYNKIRIESVSSPLVISKQINDVFVNDKTIYIASLDGIILLPNKANAKLHSTANIYFTSIYYKGKDEKENKNLELDFNDKHITFNFTAPTFYYPDGIKYQYKLNNKNWIDISNPTLELNELRPGNYTLLARAKDNNSNWTVPITYNFHVERPFYLSWWFYASFFLSIVTLIIISYRRRLYRIQSEQKLKLEYEQEINKLQLKSLQVMINPHFVFNSLSAIQQQINAGENTKANAYLTRFSKLLRKNLETINESFVTIDEEISRLNLYLETEKMRFGDKLNYSIRNEKELDIYSIYLPTMLLQPLVENAIWHGIMPSENNGEVHIYFKKLKDNLIIEIKDNGIGYNKSSELKKNQPFKKQHLGMQITKDRLKYLERKMGKTININIMDMSDVGENGTKIVIEIPFIEED